jgi:hypothetical protein
MAGGADHLVAAAFLDEFLTTSVAMSNECGGHGLLNSMPPIKAPFSFGLFARLREMSFSVTPSAADNAAVWSCASEFAVFVYIDVNDGFVVAEGTFFEVFNARISNVGRLLDTC